ncbi:Short-chain dehydrogenase [Desulfotomaculum arcticum]|uniref:Short-chain dehydrogenase n=1 Tax=Desulfotruncus arcticus DSM 17038 TaxID=1121424 RepID=A0A1I2VZQ2_9FIRM|nr:SDR family NAD(P)-dependent oxidoreductase [Desulfotruncus arcticus]SFG93286.1 Short-chain dehydrogenase [Desulfotomaculum arcticum] [Desulfotruncus arcticus DSM 17038]
MKEFKDKIAVITGAASGIGRGLAERCAREGMKVVLADIEEPALFQTQKELQASGAKVLAVRTDVSKASDVEALAQKTMDTFGAVHLLFNNAGIGTVGTIWESTLADWEWIIGVNLWGVIHGLRAFVPIMLAQDTQGHIVNTASIAGLTTGLSAYGVTKHAVVALSEQLYHSLAHLNAKVKASVLCPGFVKTLIMEAERNRPVELQNETTRILTPEEEAIVQYMHQAVQAGMSPQHAADHVFQAIREERFYIFTHPEYNAAVHKRMEDILQQRNPSNPFQS